MYVRMYNVCVHVYMYVCMYISMYVLCIYECKYVGMYVSIFVCVTYVYVCTYVCMNHICIHIYRTDNGSMLNKPTKVHCQTGILNCLTR